MFNDEPLVSSFNPSMPEKSRLSSFVFVFSCYRASTQVKNEIIFVDFKSFLDFGTKLDLVASSEIDEQPLVYVST